MFLGALLDAGVDPQVLHDATAALHLDASLRLEKVDRSGIASTKVHVFEREHPAENPAEHPAQQAQPHLHPHQQPHDPARSLTAIKSLILAAPLDPAVQHTALHIFDLLGASEARIHNVPVDRIHFHEVGAVDAIVDIVAASAGIHALQIDRWYSSPINVGGGMVDCAHGRFPVPAPATADLLRGFPTYSAHLQKELVTPTGAAILRALNPTFGPQPAMRVARIGYGAGSRNPEGFPNVLRLSVGEDAVGEDSSQAPPDSTANTNTDTVTVLETAIDDLNPQVLAHVCELALAHGALDVMSAPVTMKKGRQGTLLTILCTAALAPDLQQLLFRETSTLGIRTRTEQRTILDRAHLTVATPYGPIRIKTAGRNGETLNAAPEFEDCRTAAATHNVPVKQVLQAAIAAYASR